MIELGKTQELEIVRTKEFGVYLSEKAGDEAAVLLPKKQVPAGAKIGDKMTVFIYKDSSDRLIASGRSCAADSRSAAYNTGKSHAARTDRPDPRSSG